MNTWIPALNVFTTAAIGLAVVVIACMQWQVARNKLRLDLFDRRFKVYDATRKFLVVILREATFSDSQLFEFYAGKSDAEFLFESDVTDYLEQVRTRSIDMRAHQKMYASMPVGEERTRHVQAEHDELSWLTDQITVLTKVFKPYLGFSRIRG